MTCMQNWRCVTAVAALCFQAVCARFLAPQNGTLTNSVTTKTVFKDIQTIVITELLYETIYTASTQYTLACPVSGEAVQLFNLSTSTVAATTTTVVSTPQVVSVGNIVTTVSIVPATVTFVFSTVYEYEVYVYYSTFFSNNQFTSSLVTATKPVSPTGPGTAGALTTPANQVTTGGATSPLTGAASVSGPPHSLSLIKSNYFPNSSTPVPPQSASSRQSTSANSLATLTFTPVLSPTNCPSLPTPTAQLTALNGNITLPGQDGSQVYFYFDDKVTVVPEIGISLSTGDYVVYDLTQSSDTVFFLESGISVIFEDGGKLTIFSSDCSIAAFALLPVSTPSRRSARGVEIAQPLDARDGTAFGIDITFVDQCGNIDLSITPYLICNGQVYGPKDAKVLSLDEVQSQLSRTAGVAYHGACNWPDIANYVGNCAARLGNILRNAFPGISGAIVKARFLAPELAPPIAQILKTPIVQIPPEVEWLSPLEVPLLNVPELLPIAVEEAPLIATFLAPEVLAVAGIALVGLAAFELVTELQSVPNTACKNCLQGAQVAIGVVENLQTIPVLTLSASPSLSVSTTITVSQSVSQCPSSLSFSTSYSKSLATFSSSLSTSSSVSRSASTSSSLSTSSTAAITKPTDCTIIEPLLISADVGSKETFSALGDSVVCFYTDLCEDGSSLTNRTGECSGFANLCKDVTSTSTNCGPNQVFLSGGSPGYVNSGAGSCYGTNGPQWERANWTWSCFDCPTGYTSLGAQDCPGSGLINYSCGTCQDLANTLTLTKHFGWVCMQPGCTESDL